MANLTDCIECLRYWYAFQANERSKLLDLLNIMRENGGGDLIEKAAVQLDRERHPRT